MITYTGPEITVTTTGNIDDLAFSNASVIRMNNASLATIRGLAAGVAGQRVTIISIGAGRVDLAHQHASSTAENRFINNVTSGITPLAAGTGVATYQYDSVTDRWRLIAHNQGSAIDIAYDAGNFTASAGTWTVDVGDQVTLAYTVRDRRILLSFYIQASTTSNSAAVRITLPNSYTGLVAERSLIQAFDGAAGAAGLALIAAAGTYVEMYKDAASTNFAAQVATLYVIGQVDFALT